MRRIVGVIALACAAGSVVLPSLPETLPAPALLGGCFADDCSGTGSNVFAEQGHMIDENTWESTPYNGTWTEFSGNDYIYFHGAFGGRVPFDCTIYLSVSANPAQDGNNTTIASGNVALVSQQGPDQIMVANGTCSRYFIRVVLYAPPFPPAAGDAGADAGDPDAGDAGDLDASEPDAALDASDASDGI